MSTTYHDILHSVQKPVHYLGNEWNAVRKTGPKARKRIALCFPDTYEIGMSHLGMRILYSLLNKREDIAAERCYAPWIDLEQKLRETGTPLASLESQIPLCQFDVVGFSLQYELVYTNILMMLELGGISRFAQDRAADEPLVIGGGPGAFSPEPVANFFDCFLIGDGERAFPAVIDRFVEFRAAGLSRREILTQLAQSDGIYVPSLYKTEIDAETGFEVVRSSEAAPFPVKRTYIENINEFPFPDDILVPHSDIVHDRVSVEIARGCTEGCRFCQAGIIYRPLRERKPQDIIDSILSSLDKTGFDQASLTSLSTADFSCIGPLAQKLSQELEKRKTALSVSSLRAYGMTDELSESLSKVRRSGFTIAPEAGSQRLRDVINKGITEKVILEGARAAFHNGWQQVKLYYMIGLPTETAEDLTAIVDLSIKILKLAENEHGRKTQVTISVSSHIPKPHAPFQWLGLESIDSLRAKQKYLLNLIRPYRRLRFKWHDVQHSWLEAIFSRGDRRLGKAIELAYKRGCRFDAWTDQLDLNVWRQVFLDLKIDPEIWMQDIPLTSSLPWDHLNTLVKKEWLIQEYKRALQEKFSPACEKPFKKKNAQNRTDLGKPGENDKLVCYHCGLECDLDAIRQERVESWNSLEKTAGIVPDVHHGFEKYPEEFTRYRVSYCKLNDFRFLSALDLKRTLTRAFNRAGVPLKFSAGFHPAPAISFGPALAVGLEGAEEFLDFETIVKIPEKALLHKLNKQLPEDLHFKALALINLKADSLFNIISVAEYSVALDSEALLRYLAKQTNGRFENNSVAQHRNYVQDLLKREVIEIQKVSKGKPKTINIRPLIREINVVSAEKALQLRLVLSAGAWGSVRPDVVLEEMYGAPRSLFRIQRQRLLVEQNGGLVSPLE